MRSSPLALLLLLAAPLAAHAQANLTGTVNDRTTGKPAANDAVVLIGFGRGMQEVARTTTDAHGRYTLALPDDGTHLVRVDHQKATYFQPAPPAAHTVDLDVYDVAEAVPGIRTEADVLQMQTDPGGLAVVENFFVKNDSSPARTQLSNHAYEIYLPPGAKIDASAAMGPAGMPVASSPIPVGDPNHYAFVFPVRPGETRFQVSYHLPYADKLAIQAREALPTENLVVIVPKAMSFTPGDANFQPVPDNVQAQTFVRKGVTPGQQVSFTVAGSGSLPREQQGGPQQAGNGGQGSPTAAQPGAETTDQPGTGATAGGQSTTDTRPGGGLGAPIDTPDPLQKYKWWILSGLALLLAVAAAFLLRRSPAASAGSAVDQGTGAHTGPGASASPITTPAPLPQPGTHAPDRARAAAPPDLLTSLKETLFALEAERLSGRLGEQEYRQVRLSLDTVLRQVLDLPALKH